MVEPAEIPFRDLDELVGVTLAERFILHKEIGRGGYGAVFIGEQTSVRRRCAVKVLVPHVLEKEANIKRFEREAKMTSALAHPNTVVIYDFGLDAERRLLYLVMEYIKGESLKERIQRKGRLDLETTVWIAHQAAGSLQDAHEAGMVHRDVKPHNIMLTTRGGDADFVKVIDFGIAKFLDDDSIRETFQRVTQTGMVIGTPAYMSPEQVRSQELDGRADQYALAACVYQMLTGSRLFTGDSPIDIATKQLTQRPVPVSERNPAVTPEVERVLMRALAKNRDQRFATITEFTSALAEAAGVALRAVDSAERDRVVDDATVEDRIEETVPFALDDAESTTQPMAGEQPTQSAVVKPVAPEAPKVVRGDEPQGSGAALLLVGLVTVVVVLGAIALRGDDEPQPRREPAEPTAAATSQGSAREFTSAPTTNAIDVVPIRAEPDQGHQDRPAAAAVAAERKPVAELVVPEPTPEPKAAETGELSIALVPWGTVVIDGKERGSKRINTYELRVGKHTLELHQNGASVAKRTVDVKPGKNRMVKLIAAP